MRGREPVPTEPTALLGRWTLDRRLDDRRDGRSGVVRGRCVLTAEPAVPDRIRWSEQGTMLWTDSGAGTPVSRTLWLCRRDAGWLVIFDDGHDFHPWLVGMPLHHLCGRDDYTGRIDVLDADHWITRWTATGPAKDYTIETRLSRARDDADG